MTEPLVTTEDRWVSVAEACDQLDIGVVTFYTYLRQGRFSDITLPPAQGKGGRPTRKVRQQEIDDFKASCLNVPAVAAPADAGLASDTEHPSRLGGRQGRATVSQSEVDRYKREHRMAPHIS